MRRLAARFSNRRPHARHWRRVTVGRSRLSVVLYLLAPNNPASAHEGQPLSVVLTQTLWHHAVITPDLVPAKISPRSGGNLFRLDKKLRRQKHVRKLCRAGGKASDAMCMKAVEIFFAQRAAHLSAVPRGNPLHTSRKNSAQVYASRCFPPIHNRHHNNKGPNFVFRNYLL